MCILNKTNRKMTEEQAGERKRASKFDIIEIHLLANPVFSYGHTMMMIWLYDD